MQIRCRILEGFFLVFNDRVSRCWFPSHGNCQLGMCFPVERQTTIAVKYSLVEAFGCQEI
jgi:hypothetical protein